MIRQTPRQALAENKSLLKWRPPLDRWRPWRSALVALLDQVKESETEEFHKTLVRDYLTATLRGEGEKTCPYFINVKNYAQGGGDLVVHGDKTAESPVAVILELKRPGDRVAEMPKPDRLNGKALQQLVFYFLQERLQGGNLELKRLVISNLYEWFIFDAAQFERLFVERLEKLFLDFQGKRLTGSKTDYFYENIAQPAIADVEDQLKFVYLDLRDYEQILREETDEQALTDLFKVFAPEYWLKLPSANDSNRLDEGFYSELLHLMGLTVVKSKGKKLIQRLEEKERLPGSLLENAITQIQSLDKLASLDDPLSYGDTEEEQLFSAALALVIVWVNRVLFLKLLEAQLLSYHREERDLYRFLNGEQIKDYGALQQLFFEVLAAPVAERSPAAQGKFPRVPYLNSSLFEMTDLERRTIVISNLQNEELPVFKGTVLLDDGGKPRTGSMSALAYLFAFLNAYDFGNEETGLIKRDQRRLIYSSVLGSFFELINGYRDGSFFKPAFITMFMCRETLRRAVLQKFREVKGWDCADLTDLYNRIDDRGEANEIVNSLKICDPAVGSGHFLVSALNEMIAIKSELGILRDRSGKVLRDYHIAVVDDELAITDEEGRFFEYRPGGRESQRVQEALFHEKQTIIEGCLFGVDINENSVKICQLRLWIELLKNAYYRADGQLETLPNIDINIKRGNSLISRFPLDSDLSGALRKAGSDVATFRGAVRQYHHALSRVERRELLGLMARIKEGFQTTLFGTDPNKAKLRQLEGELFSLQNQTVLFAESKAEARAREKKVTKLQNEIDKLRAAIEEVESGRLYDNALEWRFEFPEVLTDEGDFVGFDVVIGNPPYIKEYTDRTAFIGIYGTEYYQGKMDIWYAFACKGIDKLKDNGFLCFITTNNWTTNSGASILRNKIVNEAKILQILDFGDYMIFESASIQTMITLVQKK
ncbi:MAG: Eco57I restriction-modification methylase domain-containing protein [Cyanobacteriota bacterium]